VVAVPASAAAVPAVTAAVAAVLRVTAVLLSRGDEGMSSTRIGHSQTGPSMLASLAVHRCCSNSQPAWSPQEVVVDETLAGLHVTCTRGVNDSCTTQWLQPAEPLRPAKTLRV